MKVRVSGRSGFTMVEIMIVVAIIGMLAIIAIPNYVRSRAAAQKEACINNLRQIDGAIQQYALENKKDATAPVTETDVTPYLKQGPNTACPAGGSSANFGSSYTVSACNASPTCQISPAIHILP